MEWTWVWNWRWRRRQMDHQGGNGSQFMVFWALTPWSLVWGYQCLWRNCWLESAVHLRECAGLQNILKAKKPPSLRNWNAWVLVLYAFCVGAACTVATFRHTDRHQKKKTVSHIIKTESIHRTDKQNRRNQQPKLNNTPKQIVRDGKEETQEQALTKEERGYNFCK
jgi:hypothetical protein